MGHENGILVYFGDEFIPFTGEDEEEERHVVIFMYPEDDDIVASAKVIIEEGREALAVSGTTRGDQIQKITGRWPLDRIIQATRNYYGGKNDIEQHIEEGSNEPPKTLRIHTKND